MELGIKPTSSACQPNTLPLGQNWLTSEPLMFIQPAVGEGVLAEIPDPSTCMISYDHHDEQKTLHKKTFQTQIKAHNYLYQRRAGQAKPVLLFQLSTIMVDWIIAYNTEDTDSNYHKTFD